MVATLHQHAQRWSPPPDFTRPVYDAAHFQAAAETLWQHTSTDLDEGTRLVLETALGCSSEVLERLGRAAKQIGLIHADLHDGNLVYGGEPRRAGVIDFGRCGFGCWALGVAMAVHYLTEELGAPLVAAYAARFGLTSDAEAALPHLRFLAAVENLSFLSAIPDEAAFIAAELPGLITQAEQLVR